MKKQLILAIALMSIPGAYAEDSYIYRQYQDQRAFEIQKYENQRKFEIQQQQAIDRQVESQRRIDKIRRENKQFK